MNELKHQMVSNNNGWTYDFDVRTMTDAQVEMVLDEIANLPRDPDSKYDEASWIADQGSENDREWLSLFLDAYGEDFVMVNNNLKA